VKEIYKELSDDVHFIKICDIHSIIENSKRVINKLISFLLTKLEYMCIQQ
jgi:hypothetical protein